MARRPNWSAQSAALLGELARQPELWRHGYDLARSTGLFSGTLYPLLVRLERDGFLESRWEASEHPSRPRRHFYRLTVDGCALARDMTAEITRTVTQPRLVRRPSS
jgi:PadR family transcriptional regulator PadR